MPTLTNGTVNGVLPPQRPQPGERTRKQVGRAGVFGQLSTLTGFGQPPPGTFDTYRRMRADPTIALARAAANCPVRAAPWSVEVKDGTPDEWAKFVQSQVARLWPTLVADLLRARDYGFAAFEPVWAVESGRLVLRKVKALLPDETTPLVDEHGNLVGIKQHDVRLDTPGKWAWYTYDGEYGNHFGRSWFENIRESAWHPSHKTNQNLGRYQDKGASIIAMIEYPVGESRNAEGAMEDNFEIAKRVLGNLGKGAGVTLPVQFEGWALDALRDNPSLVQALKSWQIKFLEARAGHGTEFIETLRYYDSLKVRGLLMPERVVLEGQFGTKAEAGEHADTALCIAEEQHQDHIRWINESLVDPLLVYNFGAAAKGTVYLSAGPIRDADKAFYRRVFEALLVNPATADWLTTVILDLDAMVDRADLPKSREVVDPSARPGPITPDPAGPGGPGTPAMSPEERARRLLSQAALPGGPGAR